MAIKDLLMVVNRSPASAQRLESALAVAAQFTHGRPPWRAAHLARHGVRPEVKATPSAVMAAGDVILSQPADEGADFLVMGGCGHSRMGELVLDGATRRVLAQITLPVLLSH